jgi:hypothetical protein
MKASTHLKESTAPVFSETSTTPTAVGGTCGTGKRLPVNPALLRERKRRKKLLVQNQALEALVKSYQEEEKRLHHENSLLALRLEGQMAHAETLAKRLAFLASCKEKQDGPERLVEITSTVRIDPRQIERGSRAHLLLIAEEIMIKLRVQMTETMLQALVESPLTLLTQPHARRMYDSLKTRFCHEYLMDPEKRSLVWGCLGGPDELYQFWDTVAAAVIQSAKQVPPGTEIRWVNVEG